MILRGKMIGEAYLNWPRKVEELQSSATLERENSLAYLGVLEQRSCCSGYSKFTNAETHHERRPRWTPRREWEIAERKGQRSKRESQQYLVFFAVIWGFSTGYVQILLYSLLAQLIKILVRIQYHKFPTLNWKNI